MQDTKTPGNSDPDKTPQHPIRVVARRTGLTLHALRAWERRYAVVEPQRSGTNRRLYTDADIEKLRLLRHAVASGRRISDIALLSQDDLARLIATDATACAPIPQSEQTVSALKGPEAHLGACLAAVEALHVNAFEAAIEQAAMALSRQVLMTEVIAPLMHHLGERWRDGTLRITHEHLATTQIRSFLGMLLATSNLADSGAALVVAAPSGQVHELGALVAAVTAATEGWQVVYLGPNVPMEAIATTAEQHAAKAVALSLTCLSHEQQLVHELKTLRTQLSKDVCILAGGTAAPQYRRQLESSGVQVIDGLAAFREALDTLRKCDPQPMHRLRPREPLATDRGLNGANAEQLLTSLDLPAHSQPTLKEHTHAYHHHRSHDR